MFRLHHIPGNIDLIRDPIYGFIEVPRVLRPLIDAPEVQRLRWVSQLPLEQMVYPSAQHSRFEHSLGVMYLSMVVATTLLDDEVSHDRIRDTLFSKLPQHDQWKTYFVLSAGIVGLLHDVGHAPFSHTFEEAVRGLPREGFSFHHETLSFVIAKELLKNDFLKLQQEPSNERLWSDYKRFILYALNKEKSVTEIPPIARILRSIVDGPIDTDKGDYLLRDAYHCGVNYGTYDIERLWRFVRISESFTLGVHPKGALEAWTLRFARYKMFQNVYWHHVRDITDALLVDAIQSAFMVLSERREEREENKNAYEELCPIKIPLDSDATLIQEERYGLLMWTDTSLLRALERVSNDNNLRKVSEILDWIRHRSLPKRLFKSPFPILAPIKRDFIEPYREQIRSEVQEILDQYSPTRNPRVWVVLREVQPFPLLDPDTRRIPVVIREDEELSLPHFLGFYDQLRPEEDLFEENLPTRHSTEVRVFTKEKIKAMEVFPKIRNAVLSVIQQIQHEWNEKGAGT